MEQARRLHHDKIGTDRDAILSIRNQMQSLDHTKVLVNQYLANWNKVFAHIQVFLSLVFLKRTQKLEQASAYLPIFCRFVAHKILFMAHLSIILSYIFTYFEPQMDVCIIKTNKTFGLIMICKSS
ncbi:MAG: hypothetical protein IPK62_05050 [Bacteroidetes bacterium]|nr:hypothetical protein [Bacteroidota bacterium]